MIELFITHATAFVAGAMLMATLLVWLPKSQKPEPPSTELSEAVKLKLMDAAMVGATGPQSFLRNYLYLHDIANQLKKGSSRQQPDDQAECSQNLPSATDSYDAAKALDQWEQESRGWWPPPPAVLAGMGRGEGVTPPVAAEPSDTRPSQTRTNHTPPVQPQLTQL